MQHVIIMMKKNQDLQCPNMRVARLIVSPSYMHKTVSTVLRVFIFSRFKQQWFKQKHGCTGYPSKHQRSGDAGRLADWSLRDVTSGFHDAGVFTARVWVLRRGKWNAALWALVSHRHTQTQNSDAVLRSPVSIMQCEWRGLVFNAVECHFIYIPRGIKAQRPQKLLRNIWI